MNTANTIRQHSIRVVVTIASLFGYDIWTQDVSQAYLQASESLKREIYVRPPVEFQLSSDKLLRLDKPLYGLSDAGDYWHETFAKHLKGELRMNSTTGYLSLYIRRDKKGIAGVIGSYVYDTISTGTKDFAQESLITESKF